MPGKFSAPRVPDLSFIRNFMLVIGSIGSVFDFLTFYILLAMLQADEICFKQAGSLNRCAPKCW